MDEFSHKGDGYHSHCKECQRQYVREHYQKNKDYYAKKARRRDDRINEWYREFKETLKCERCDEDHVACIEFHHIDPSEKDLNLAEAVRNSWGIERLKKEIKKCMVLCSNCHRKLHYEEKHLPGECEGCTQGFEP